MANELTDAAAIAASMANIYKLRPAKQQFTVWAETLKFFKPKTIRKVGDQWHFKVFVDGMTAVRQTKTGSESEFPAPRVLKYADVYVDQNDISEFQASYAYTGLAKAISKDRRSAVADAAEDIVSGMDLDFARKVNAAVHQSDDLVLALVVDKYDGADGGAYTPGDDPVYLQIDGGSIARFQTGMVVDIRVGNDITSWRTSGIINDVYQTSVGPNAVADIGPGITVTYDAVAKVARGGADTTFNNVVDNDEICLSMEAADNFDSFEKWFSATTDLLSITRISPGSYWSVPFLYDFTAAGAPVDFDFDDHLRAPAEDLAYAIRAGRADRARKNRGDIQITGAMVAVTTPRIASEAAAQAGDSARFTIAMATSLDQATRRELFGEIGFNGMVYQHQNLPPIAFLTDPVASPNKLRILEPNSWFFVAGHEGGIRQPEKLDKDGHWFRYVVGTNGRPVNKLIAGSLMRLELCCDQPKANLEIAGIKSSLA